MLAARHSQVMKHRLGDLYRSRQCRLKYGDSDHDVWSESVEETHTDHHIHDHHTAAICHPTHNGTLFSIDRFPSTAGMTESVAGEKVAEAWVEAWVVDSEVVIEMVDGGKSRLIKNSRRGMMVGVLNVDKHTSNGSFIFRRKVVSCRPLKLKFTVKQESRAIVTMQVSEDACDVTAEKVEVEREDRQLDADLLQRVQDVTLPLFCGAVHKTGGDAEKLRPTLQTFMTGEDSDLTELGACRTDWTKSTLESGHVVHLPKTRSVFTVNMSDSITSATGHTVKGTHVTLATLDLLRSLLIVPNKVDEPCDVSLSTETDPRSQDLRILSEALSPKSLLFALTAVVLERPVILRSRSTSTLALATFALSRLADSSLGLGEKCNTGEEPPRRMICPLLPFCKLQSIRERRYHVPHSNAKSAQLRPCLVGIDSRVLEAAELIELRDGAHAPLSPLASDQGSMLRGTRSHGDVRWAWGTGGSLENLEGTHS